MCAMPDSLISLESFWQSSAMLCKVKFGSPSNLVRTLHLISVSLADTSPCTNIRHLKLSVLS